MKRLKVIPEIFIWFAFSVVAGFGYAFSFFGYIDSHAQMSYANIVIPTLVWLLLAVICTLLLRAAQNTQCFIHFSRYESLFLECSVFLLLLVGGWVFRFVDYFHAAWPAEADHTYFLYAQVSENATEYMNPHPASRLYVGFLHIICLFLGNSYTAGAYAQFVLLILAVFLWYFAIRKALGKVTALFFVAGAMLLPDSITASMQCNPMMLLFLFYGFIAFLLVEYVYSNAGSFLMYMHVFLLGFCVMLALLFDISGVLAVAAYLVLLLYRDKRDKESSPRRFTSFWEVLGLISGGWCFRFVQAKIYGMGYTDAGSLNGFQGLSLKLPDIEQVKDFVFELGSHPIFIVAITVISVYWFLDRKAPATWIMLAELFLLAVQFLKLDFYLEHDFLIYIGIILLLGIAAGQYLSFSKEEVCETADVPADASEAAPDEADADILTGTKADEVAEPVVTVIHFEEEPAVVVPEKPAEKPLIFIPKSMEIPKRVSKPKVDFAVEVEEARLHFDYPVEETADFDIP